MEEPTDVPPSEEEEEEINEQTTPTNNTVNASAPINETTPTNASTNGTVKAKEIKDGAKTRTVKVNLTSVVSQLDLPDLSDREREVSITK